MNCIKTTIENYKNKKDVSYTHRYISFDFCYEYFYYNKGNLTGINLQTSCCQLWSFLASWGMIVRGNELQRMSYASIIGVIEYINSHPQFYNVTLEDYNYIDKVLELYEGIDNALGFTEQKSRKTLITKIILGVYACCPAFDSRFCKTFGISPLGKLSRRNLQRVVDFYKTHKNEIDNIRIFTSHFNPNDINKCLRYTPAKLIDMYGFEKNGKEL